MNESAIYHLTGAPNRVVRVLMGHAPPLVARSVPIPHPGDFRLVQTGASEVELVCLTPDCPTCRASDTPGGDD